MLARRSGGGQYNFTCPRCSCHLELLRRPQQLRILGLCLVLIGIASLPIARLASSIASLAVIAVVMVVAIVVLVSSELMPQIKEVPLRVET